MERLINKAMKFNGKMVYVVSVNPSGRVRIMEDYIPKKPIIEVDGFFIPGWLLSKEESKPLLKLIRGSAC